MYRRYDIISKMVDGKIASFSESELDRVFAGCASPKMCKRAVAVMLEDDLTIEEIYNVPFCICVRPVYGYSLTTGAFCHRCGKRIQKRKFKCG